MSNSNREIQIKEQTLWNFVFMDTSSNKNRFRIPDFQRPYTRSTQNIEDYRRDIRYSWDTFQFVGTFIFQDKWDWYLDVVDWQQRLLSTAILLCVLKNIARDLWDELLVWDIQECLTERKRWSRESWASFLKCREKNDIDYFVQEWVFWIDWDLMNMKESLWRDKTKTNVYKNYLWLRKVILSDIEVMDKNEKINYISKTLELLWNNQIVTIIVYSDEDAYTAFEVVNARWEDLWPIDLLKNLFIKEASRDNNEDLIKKKRDKILENLKNGMKHTRTESFLKQFWHSRYWKTRPITSRKLYTEFKSKTINWNYENFIDQMLADSEIYLKVNKTNKHGQLTDFDLIDHHKYSAQISRSIQSLKRMWIKQTNVIFLSIFRNKEILKEENIRDLVVLLDNFHFIYSAVWKWQANRVEKLYWNIAEKFENAMRDESDWNKIRLVYDELKSKILWLIEEVVPKNVFLQKFIGKKHSWNNKDYIRKALTIYEESLVWTEKMPDFTWSNIEHINGKNDDSIIKWAVEDIGNLMLFDWKKNWKLQDKPTVEKIEKYKESDFKTVIKVVEQFEKSKKRGQEEIDVRSNIIWEGIFDYVHNEINKSF